MELRRVVHHVPTPWPWPSSGALWCMNVARAAAIDCCSCRYHERSRRCRRLNATPLSRSARCLPQGFDLENHVVIVIVVVEVVVIVGVIVAVVVVVVDVVSVLAVVVVVVAVLVATFRIAR